eukprot:COSAG01_NODE_4296_length_5164_cov_3.628701_10_plen_194_part_00
MIAAAFACVVGHRFATFASLAGVDATDHRAAAHSLPPIDSVDQSSALFGPRRGDATAGVLAPGGRQDIVLGGLVQTQPVRYLSRAIISSKAMGGAVLNSDSGGVSTQARSPPETLYKLLLGSVKMATWSGPRFPNASSASVNYQHLNDNCTTGCLYEVLSGAGPSCAPCCAVDGSTYSFKLYIHDNGMHTHMT